MGIAVKVLDPTPDCPAAAVAEQVLGSFRDPQAVRSLLAHPSHVSTHAVLSFVPEQSYGMQSFLHWSGWQLISNQQLSMLTSACGCAHSGSR